VQQRRRREQNVVGVKHVAGQRPEQPLTCEHLQHSIELQPFTTRPQTVRGLVGLCLIVAGISDLLLIITSTADDLSGGTNIDDLERPWTPKIWVWSEFFCYFRLRCTLRVNYR